MISYFLFVRRIAKQSNASCELNLCCAQLEQVPGEVFGLSEAFHVELRWRTAAERLGGGIERSLLFRLQGDVAVSIPAQVPGAA